VIVVTGASRGLGRDICERLVSKGVEVIGVSRTSSTSSFESLAYDVSSAIQVKELAKLLRNSGRKVDGLVNAAGIASMNLALTTPMETSKRIVETNLLGTMYCSQAIGPLLVRNKGGSIINFSTIAVALALSGEAVYVASKAGVEGFTRAFAREMAGFNVRVNCIAPGPIATDLIRGVSDTQINEILSRQILPRQFTPSDVSDLVELLLDPRSSSISGQVLNVGGA
jgi:3-oxoacyl-[acyl-carrier protein] reductase